MIRKVDTFKSPPTPRQFTPEFRDGAVRLVLDEGPAGAVTHTEREDLSRLRKENKLLRMERVA